MAFVECVSDVRPGRDNKQVGFSEQFEDANDAIDNYGCCPVDARGPRGSLQFFNLWYFTPSDANTVI